MRVARPTSHGTLTLLLRGWIFGKAYEIEKWPTICRPFTGVIEIGAARGL